MASNTKFLTVPLEWMLDQYRTRYAGWNVKHFHEHLQELSLPV